MQRGHVAKIQDAYFFLFQCSLWRPFDFVVKRTIVSFNMMISLILVFFYVGFLCDRFGPVVKLARCSCSHQPPILNLVFSFV